MKVSKHGVGPGVTGGRSATSAQRPENLKAKAKQPRTKADATRADSFQRAQSSSAFGKLVGAATRGSEGQGSDPIALTYAALTELAEASIADRAASREAAVARFATKIGSAEAGKAQVSERHAAERNQAWTNVGMAVVVGFATSFMGAEGRVRAGAQAITGVQVPTGALGKAVGDVVSHLQSGDVGPALGRWGEGIREAGSDGKKLDVNSLIQHVLRESYLESTQDLRDFAQKVKDFNEAKKAIREEISGSRDPGSAIGESDPAHEGSGVLIDPGLGGRASGLDEQLQSVGDDAQLANIDLQSSLQRMQQQLQTISNVSKLLQDSAMAVIRKLD